MYEAELEQYLIEKKEDMLRDLAMLIRIDSSLGTASDGKPFGDGAAAVFSAAQQMMEGYGLLCRNYENYVLTADLNDKPRSLDILAHLDVVPGGDGWKLTAPFAPLIQDGRIYGRGTADDKGPMIAALYAMRAIKDLHLPFEKNVRLILGGCEECGGGELEYYYAREKAAEFCFSPDADFPVINAERGITDTTFAADISDNDADCRVTAFHAGIKQNMVPGTAAAAVCGISEAAVTERLQEEAAKRSVQLTVSAAKDGVTLHLIGEGCHSSTPENGKNALLALLELVNLLPTAGNYADRLRALGKIFPYGVHHGEAAGIDLSDGASGRITASLNMLSDEDGVLRGIVDCRVPICAGKENFTDVLHRDFREAGFTVEKHTVNSPHYVSADSPFVQKLLHSYEKITGVRKEPIAIGGGTYVHNLENGVAFGCADNGIDNRMHGADEFMEIASLIQSARIFADAILSV